MKTGVSTTPWARSMRPRRAAPDVARTENRMPGAKCVAAVSAARTPAGKSALGVFLQPVRDDDRSRFCLIAAGPLLRKECSYAGCQRMGDDRCRIKRARRVARADAVGRVRVDALEGAPTVGRDCRRPIRAVL